MPAEAFVASVVVVLPVVVQPITAELATKSATAAHSAAVRCFFMRHPLQPVDRRPSLTALCSALCDSEYAPRGP